MTDYNYEDVVPTDLSHKEDFGAIDEIADVINDEHSEDTDEYNNVDTEEKLRLNLLVPKKKRTTAQQSLPILQKVELVPLKAQYQWRKEVG